MRLMALYRLLQSTGIIAGALSRLYKSHLTQSLMNSLAHRVHQSLGLVLLFLIQLPLSAIEQGDNIINKAQLTFSGGAALSNNTVSVLFDGAPDPAVIQFWRASVGANGGSEQSINTGFCSESGALQGPFTALADAQFSPLMGASPEVQLFEADSYNAGDPIFIRVVDKLANQNSAAVETLVVQLRVAFSDEVEVIQLVESAADSSEFVGFIQSVARPAQANDCALSVFAEAQIIAEYTNALNITEAVSSTALVDPFGTVFNAQTGTGISGAIVTLVEATTGLPAQVFGDGPQFAPYPSTVISGQTVIDAAGREYFYEAGQFRFPFVAASDYRLEVIPPAGFNFPTGLTDEEIFGLHGANQFVVVEGSRGETFAVPDGPPKQVDLPADANDIIEEVEPSTAKIDFLSVVNAVDAGVLVNVNPTQCALGAMPAPVTIFGDALPSSGEFNLQETTHFKTGEPVFIRVSDSDQNRNPLVVEHIIVTLSGPNTLDLEYLSLTETNANSGSFIGYIQTVAETSAFNDCRLSVSPQQNISVTYTDAFNNTDRVSAQALVDPYGIVFDSETGERLDGIVINLIDVATGELAEVFGDDGLSDFPASIVTGGQVQDGGGNQYQFGPGEYRFPFVKPGEYQIQVQTPALYAHPSTRGSEQLQQIPGAPYEIVLGSRAENFTVPVGPALRVDLPLDRQKIQLFLTKSSSKSSVAIGEFLQYKIQLSNSTRETGLPSQIDIVDELPLGLRYQSGSSKMSQQNISDPQISADGSQLTFAVVGEFAELEELELSYVVEVTAATPLGEAVNRVTAQGPDVEGANVANASVLVKEDLLRSRATLLGRVIVGSCDGDESNNLEGLSDVRIFFEDGSYVDTDQDGKWHLEGVLPGTHIVQLDTQSLPDRYQVHACEQNTRFSGTAYSQFVDVRGGSLWRADFYLKEAPPPHGDIVVEQVLQLNEEQLFGEITVRNQSPVSLQELKLVYRAPKGWQLRDQVMQVDGIEQRPSNSIIGQIVELDPLTDHRITFALKPKAAGAVINAKAVSSAYVRYVSNTTPKGRAKPVKLALSQLYGLGDQQLVSNTQDPQQAAVAIASTQPNSALTLSGKILKAVTSTKIVGSWEQPQDATETKVDQDKPLGILGFRDGQSLAGRIASVRVRLDSRLAVRLLLDDVAIAQERIGFTMDEPASQTTLYNFIGVDFGEPGVHRLVLQGVDASGKVSDQQNIRLTVNNDIHRIELLGASTSVADGRTPLKVRFALFDENNQVLGAGARLLIKNTELSPYKSLSQRQAKTLNDNLVVDGKDQNIREELVIGADGYAYFNPVNSSGVYQVTLQANEFEQEFEVYVKPAVREWIMVGFAEGTVGYRNLSGHVQNLQQAELADKYYKDGRMAFYAKGSIQGQWLLTAAYDTAKQDQNKLFQNIDPQAYYTLYADNTQQAYDASSASKLYLKVEKGQFSALYGDYNTGLGITELAKYNRSLTGIKTEYFGDKWRFNGFAALTDQAFLRDEIRGDGTSGLYRLSGSDLLANSETIVIETRDRFRSQEILSRVKLNRHIDYSIDYNDGSLFFKQPVLSQDESFNPVYIVVEYETSGEGSGNKKYTGGGRVGYLHDMGDQQSVELGATLIHEGNENRESDLQGLDAEWKISQSTKLRAEFAHSAAQTDEGDQSGNAYLIELEHRARSLDASAYIREQQQGFGIGQQAASERGSRKMGAKFAYDIAANNKFSVDLSRETNLETARHRDVATIDYTYDGERIRIRGGAKVARDSGGDDATRQSNLITTGANYSFFKERLNLRVDGEIGIGGKGANSEHPTRVIVGTDVKLTEWATVYAEQELTFGEDSDTRDTRIGVRSDVSPWQGGRLSSSVETTMGEAGERVFANLGVEQNIQLNENWAFDMGLDRSQVLRNQSDSAGNGLFSETPSAQGGSSDFTAVYLGANYTEESWEASSRLEYRHAKANDKYNFALGVIHELSDGMVTSARFDVRADRGESDNIDAALRLSLAYRPLGSQWTVLNRLDLGWQQQSGGTFDSKAGKIINNFNANYKYSQSTQLSFQYGAKFVRENIDQQSYDGFTDLMGIELRHDINPRIDVGMHANMLHSWSADVLEYSYGVSLGYNLMRNTWVSLGYNFDGYQDDDFSAAEYSAQGPYLKFRIKVDQDSIRDLLKNEVPQN